MLIEQGFGAYILLIMTILTIVVASLMIPLFGFLHKRWKGLALGCLIQPFAIALFFLLTILAYNLVLGHDIRKQTEEAMVIVQKTDTIGNKEIWYLKPNDECFYKFKDKEEDDSRKGNLSDLRHLKFFDVLPLDSNGVCVDDKIFVHFDFQKHQAKATEFDEPLKVVSVNWDKVTEYFNNQRKKPAE